VFIIQNIISISKKEIKKRKMYHIIVGDELLENGRKTYSNQICAAAAGL